MLSNYTRSIFVPARVLNMLANLEGPGSIVSQGFVGRQIPSNYFGKSTSERMRKLFSALIISNSLPIHGQFHKRKR